MQHYELLYILPGTLGEDEVPNHIETVKKLLTGVGATEVSVTAQGKNRLAYPMKHIRYGYFQLGSFQAEPKLAPIIEAKLALVEGMLRVIIRKFDPTKKPTTAIAFAGMMNAPGAQREEASEDHRAPEPIVPRKEKPAPAPAVIEPAAKPTETKVEDVNLEDINKKLDQLLETDLTSV